MLALLTAIVFAQSTISIGIGNKPNLTDSAQAVREKRLDSLRMAREIWRDSMFMARPHRDSVDIARRRAKQVALTPALQASAFHDSRAAGLLAAARKARLEQDSSLTGYDATTYERMSVGLGFKRIGRDRLLMRSERAARVVWSRGGPAYVEILGKRAAMPILGAGDAEIDIDNVPIPYSPGRETLWVGSGLAKADIDESEIIHPLARGAEAYYTYAAGDSVSFQLPGGQRINLRELLIRPRAPKWNVALGSLWFDMASARLVRAVYRLAEPMDIWAIADEEAKAEHDDDPPPRWVKAMISPLKAQVNAVTVEYGLHEGRFWLPRVQSLEGSAQAGFMRVPFKMEQSFKYASVNGLLPIAIPQIAVSDTASDSVSRAARIARRRTECKSGGLRVADTGCGMDAETLARVFEPFFTTKEMGKGTGLGLATVYGIIKQHQGWIQVASQPGQGTSFHIFLPATSELIAAVKQSPPAGKPRGGSETILIVEDEPVLRDLAQVILEDCGYKVIAAASGLEALDLWSRTAGTIDLLVSDVIMPAGISGMDLAQRLLLDQPELKIIFASGYSMDELDPEFLSKGRAFFLQKPYTHLSLPKAVRDCLDQEIVSLT